MSLASGSPREESRCDGGSDGSARGGDTSNGASLQHWRRPPTTALRGVGGLSSTTLPRGPTTASAMEEEVREVNGALEGLKRPCSGGASGTSEVAGL